MRIDPSLELTRVKIGFETRDKALRITCPFHDDKTPSCDVFLDTASYQCYACGAAGSFAALLARVTHSQQHVVQAELEARYGSDEKPIDTEQIERYHRNIWSNKTLLDELYARAINDNTIRKYRLGVDGDRITIPIPDPAGLWVNVRRYKPGATQGPKMTSMKGRGKRYRMYPFEQLRFDKILLCGGEIKALASAQALNKHGYGAVALSGGGESNWTIALEQFFVNKRVWVVPDIDVVGLEAAAYRCSRISLVAEWVGMVDLPLDSQQFPHGDINDYLHLHSDDDLLSVITNTPDFVIGNAASLTGDTTEEDPVDVQIADINTSRFVNKRIKCSVVISAIDQNIYYVPRRLKVECNKDQDYCALCPVFFSKTSEFSIKEENPAILAITESRKNALRDELLDALKIPSCCSVCKFETLENFKVVETRVQRALELSEQSSDKFMLPAVIVDDDIDLNETYEITGKPVPHPKTQAATMIVSNTRPVADALSTFDPGNTDDLLVFRPNSWNTESIDDKMLEIHRHLERNVTRIYDRVHFHYITDLVYHSVLSIVTEGRPMKGLLELLVIGDSSQGKSETLIRLIEYYGLGIRVDCKNATIAGLLGGLEQIGGKWFAQWGIIPTHDRRLVVLEELKGLRRDVFAKLTDMRSSGWAELPKIIRRRAPARTRLIALTNPMGSSVMSEYSYGIRAVPDIITGPEDIRRFDSVVILNREDIDPNAIYTRREGVAPPFAQDTAKRLVLWAWTRKADQVRVLNSAHDYAIESGKGLCEQFYDGIPVVDRGSAWQKVLRFATALACRTFSTDESQQCVIVRPEHVEWCTNLLRAEYETKHNGYAAYSQQERDASGKCDVVACQKEIERAPYPQLLCQRLSITHDIDLQDLQDWCGWSRDEANLFLSALVRANGLKRNGKYYRKTSGIIELIKTISQSDVSVVPAFIENDKETY